MTDDRTLERAARSWLEEGPTRAPDRPVEAAIARIHTTHQERGGFVPWRLSMNPIVRIAGLATVLLVAVGGSLYLLGRGDGGVGGQSSPPPTATVNPSATEVPSSTPTAVIVARNLAFDRQVLVVAAGTPFTILLRNADQPGLPHDIDIRSVDETDTIEDQIPLDGGQAGVYMYGALEPGQYKYICSVHPIPSMTGTLTVR